MKHLGVLGSTGSIGTATLDVVSHFPDRFSVATLAAGHNVALLREQIRTHRPEFVAVAEEADARALAAEFPDLDFGAGESGRIEAATRAGVTTVIGAFVGALGLRPVWNALELGLDVLLANKETLVVAGELIMRLAAERGATVLPIDSEHNALHQALRVGPERSVRRLILTASGGPFRTANREELEAVTIAQALAHPTWKMGAKITVDSATMMNKGLEIIEAHHLFAMPGERIDVLVHPQSLVHSLVEYVDGTLIAQLSINDMRFPILYALAWPERLPSPYPSLDLAAVGALNFEHADVSRFPALAVARAALAAGGTVPAVMNAANEEAVAAFLAGRLRFIDITRVVDRVAQREATHSHPLGSLDDAIAADARGRARARELIADFPVPNSCS